MSPQRWMEALTQQGALLELQVWLGAAESRLEEHRGRIEQSCSSNTDLRQLLRCCKVEKTARYEYKRPDDLTTSCQQEEVLCRRAVLYIWLADCLSIVAFFSGVSDRDVGPSGHAGPREPAAAHMQY